MQCKVIEDCISASSFQRHLTTIYFLLLELGWILKRFLLEKGHMFVYALRSLLADFICSLWYSQIDHVELWWYCLSLWSLIQSPLKCAFFFNGKSKSNRNRPIVSQIWENTSPSAGLRERQECSQKHHYLVHMTCHHWWSRDVCGWLADAKSAYMHISPSPPCTASISLCLSVSRLPFWPHHNPEMQGDVKPEFQSRITLRIDF